MRKVERTGCAVRCGQYAVAAFGCDENATGECLRQRMQLCDDRARIIEQDEFVKRSMKNGFR